jgi:hypothetical protein
MWKCFTDSEVAALLNAEDDLADSNDCVVDPDEDSGDEEESAIFSDQDDDSDSAGASVGTETYVLLRHGKLYWKKGLVDLKIVCY